MTVPAYLRVADPALQRYVDQARQEFRDLETVAFLVGTLVEIPKLAAAGVFTVTHGLRRTPRGWLLAYVQRASGGTSQLAIYARQGERWDSTALELYSTGDFELLRLWVF